ncbi:MAG: Uma2 family endonuclease [Methylohalobius sp. ZOD2]
MLSPELLPHYTIQDFQRWEGDWELIEGIPYAMVPSPTFLHQRIIARIIAHLEDVLEPCADCQAVLETDWIVREDIVVRPDIMVVCGPIEGDYPTRAPRLIFEIISPSTALRDERIKFDLYEREGVGFYILVYPDRKTAKLFQWQNGCYIKRTDIGSDRETFDWGDCRIEFDFAKIWP